jgi:hypothetical protein
VSETSRAVPARTTSHPRQRKDLRAEKCTALIIRYQDSGIRYQGWARDQVGGRRSGVEVRGRRWDAKASPSKELLSGDGSRYADSTASRPAASISRGNLNGKRRARRSAMQTIQSFRDLLVWQVNRSRRPDLSDRTAVAAIGRSGAWVAASQVVAVDPVERGRRLESPLDAGIHPARCGSRTVPSVSWKASSKWADVWTC